LPVTVTLLVRRSVPLPLWTRFDRLPSGPPRVCVPVPAKLTAPAVTAAPALSATELRKVIELPADRLLATTVVPLGLV